MYFTCKKADCEESVQLVVGTDADQKAKAQRRVAAKAMKERRILVRVLKKELKIVAVAAVLCWGYGAGLIAAAFLAPALIVLMALCCLRAGFSFGRLWEL